MSWKMKKICTTKDRIKNKHKKYIFQNHKHQNPKFRSPMNSQHTHNALTNQKSSAAYFKDVKTEEAFSNQDQSQGKLPICDDNFLRIKITTEQIRFCNDR